MNTKFLFFTSVVLFTIGDAMAQHAVVQANYPNDVERTIVREYAYPATVSYVETAVEHYFAYADASMTVTNCEISHDISVTDMELHGQFAYFCGYNTVSGVGVWGWFNVNTLIGGALSYYTYDNFDCGGLYADSLFSLAVYEEQGQLHIATVGSTTDGAGKKRVCLIDITGTEGSATGWNYSMGMSECEFNYFNRLTEVCVTDKYIVAAGAADPVLCSEGYRIHHRGNPFMAGGPQDSLFVFPGTGVSPNHNGSDMALTYTSNDHFASAVYWYNNIYSNTPDGILINVYDIAQVLTVYAVSPVYSKYTPLPAGSKYSIFDLIYNRTSNSLYLLTNGNILFYTGSFVSELPLPLPANFDFFYMQDVYLTSLDNYNGHHNILAQGNDGSNTHTSTYYTQPVSTAPFCAPYYTLSTDSSTYSKKTFYCPYTVCSVSFDCIKFSQNKPMIIPNNNICLQP